MTRETVLNAVHRAAGAKMVDFGGWDMPLHYGSQIDEHHKVRQDAGMFDVSHMCAVDLAGTDSRAFLRRLLANNVDKLQSPGKALYSAMLNPQGGVIDDLIVYFLDETHFRIVINAGTADKDLAWMNACHAEWKHTISLTARRDLAMIAVQGPNARARALTALPELAAADALSPFFATAIGDVFVARTGYTGEDGFEIAIPAERAATVWQALAAAGIAPCGLGARDTLRLEAGMNLYGQDMDESISPLDAGLAWTVDLISPRDFVGKAALLAHGQKHQFLGLLLEDRGVLRAHQQIFSAHGEGEITSGSFSPTLQRSIALARLPLGIAIGDHVEVDIRGKRLAARVLKPVFVRRGQALI
ncbi:glycine cleavage system aminomethyltransferase GcvT [Rhodocyclus tenuis]|uniref:glycine cleavage system aminomethyltransferase GcvT n=1 Tax=Rhodocyclus gracilis TaxID=2929842 RepID=UPI001298E626|nr:glycine cleavage system aminomethyltransferase GcvT [Rhodocyclus gracilis]MRD72024.1 glycine cleavage system aminomethyltransferase GcvT [Rhodocyclus gracilis]